MTYKRQAEDVFVQDQTTAPFQYYMMQHLNESVTLANPIAIDDEDIDLNSGHGFSIGEYFVVWENSAFEQAKVTNVVGDTITLELPVANPFTVSSTVIRGSIDFAVDGSLGIDYFCKPFNLRVPIDIESVIVTIQSGANVPDDGKFGGITVLTNGIYFRQVNGARTNLGNYINNQAFRDRGALITYTDKAPAGTNGTIIEFDIKDSFGIVIRIGRGGEYILGRLRDNIGALDVMYVSLLGQYTLGE